MGALPTELRNQLSKACVAAREEAEKGARAALQALAVHHHEPHGSMTTEQRALRNRLRAHGRQLGDTRDAKRGTQAIDRLVQECAYEHWHRMLFARFLAENHLLIEPKSGVAITMEECEELARDAGEDPWALASRFAQRMLPQIFRPDDPVLAVGLPPETRQALERLLGDLPAAVFTADDALGWTYQFWQSAEKDRVNASGEKVSGATLPAVTQLFTEHYMVLFLLHNTIGAWHAGKMLARRPELAENAASEQELRDAVALDDYQFEYLRFVRDKLEGDEEGNPMGPWRPAAGTFDGWPKCAAELRVLDPCCGSGHFLVEVFVLLVRLRMAEERLSLEEAIRAVLKDNIFGLELDARCTQIAAFNLALAAWRIVGKVIDLPELNIACSGLAPNATKEEWLTLAESAATSGGMPVRRDLFRAEESLLSSPLKAGMEAIYDLFAQAPELGSLIDPRRATRGSELLAGDFSSLQPLLSNVLVAESDNDEAAERAVAAQGMVKAAEILVGPTEEYTLIITNVPYLTRHMHSETLIRFADAHYHSARADLATIFIARLREMLCKGGSVALVVPQNWLHQYRYKDFRRDLLRGCTWGLTVWLGPGSFETISGEVVKPVLLSFASEEPPERHAVFCIDVSDLAYEQKIAAVSHDTTRTRMTDQSCQLNNPDSRFLFHDVGGEGNPLSKYAECYQGLRTGDGSRFVRTYWELCGFTSGWVPFKASSDESAGLLAGHTHAILWEQGQGRLARYAKATRDRLHDMHESGNKSWGQRGIAFGQITLRPTHYFGQHFDNTLAVITAKRQSDLPAIVAFCTSPDYVESVRQIERGLYVTNASLLKVPCDIDQWRVVAAETFPHGLPDPQSNDPTQWLFHGHPTRAEPTTVPQVAVARLLDYHWPAELDPGMRLAPEARALVNRCAELAEHADEDGIVCLWPVRGEASGADRLRAMMAAAFVDAWSASKERELLQVAADVFNKGKAAKSLEDWLVDWFFEEHCKLFHHRPFVWHIWDGRADGFNALVNYHKLAGPDGEGRRTLESLTFSYLGDWIERQRADQREGKEGADARLAAALDLQEQLKKILAGEPPYDIFVRWKPLHEQPIGWEPDINDGVRLNIRPFMSATLRKGGKKGAGILRTKPNIKWTKDRGKEPESLRPKGEFPWFWSCDPEKKPEHRENFMGGAKFDGNRWNDLHYSNEVKRKARERAAKEQ